jgi:hypothetical protein
VRAVDLSSLIMMPTAKSLAFAHVAYILTHLQRSVCRSVHDKAEYVSNTPDRIVRLHYSQIKYSILWDIERLKFSPRRKKVSDEVTIHNLKFSAREQKKEGAASIGSLTLFTMTGKFVPCRDSCFLDHIVLNGMSIV